MVCSRDVCQPIVFFLYYAKFTSSNLRKIFFNFCHWLILWTFSCISKIVVIKRTRVHACCCEANCQQPELHRHRFGFHTHCTKARGRGHTCKFSRKTCRSWCILFGLTGDLKSIAHDLELCVWSCVSEGVDFTHIEKIYIQEERIIATMRGRNTVLLILLFLASFTIVYILRSGPNVLQRLNQPEAVRTNIL